MADEKDPIAEMLSIPDEAARTRELPEAELNTDPPADKDPPERDETGKFKGKEEKEPKKEDPPKKQDDVVPLAKFLDERNKLKGELDLRDKALAAKEKEFLEKLAALEAKIPKPQEPAEPDYVEDPKGYVDHKLGKTLQAIEEANKKAAEQGEQAKKTADAANEQVQFQRFMGELQTEEQRFVQQNPDYYDALGHLRNIRVAQLRELVPDITEQQIRETITREEITLAVNLKRQGRDPMQVAYNLAKHHGYAPKAKEPGGKEVTKLPDPPTKRLPPDQTLGSGSGEEAPVYKEWETDPVDLALASLFKKRA